MTKKLSVALSELTGDTVLGGNIQIEGDLDKSTVADFKINGRLQTLDGGAAKKYINNTGAASIKGTLVRASISVDEGVDVALVDSVDHIGVIYEDGIANGGEVWVVIEGDAKILLEDSTAATRGYWAKPSATVPGRVDATNAGPSGGTIAALEEHFTEVGHVEESVSAGTDKLATIHLHFN